MLCGGVFLVFAAATLGVTWQLRQALRHQLVARDAEILQAVIWMEHVENMPAGQPSLIPLTEPAEQASILLRASRLKGVLAVRLFDTNGHFVVSFPPSVRETRLTDKELGPLRRLQFLSRYYEAARLEALFIPQTDQTAPRGPAPLLEMFIPINEPGRPDLLGVAQFYVDGQPLKEKYRAQDRHLAGQAAVVLAVGALVILGGLGAALRHLQKQHQTLLDLTERLARANQELTLAAKTSAVGAVAAHLIHGLKSPLYGLHNLLLSEALGKGAAREPAWQAALETTQKLQQMIQDTARLLQQDAGVSPASETRLQELLELLRCRMESLLVQGRVKLHLRTEADARLSSREAALVALILENLLRNAIQASSPGQIVELRVRGSETEVICEVRDQGPGLPEAMRSQVFAPCVSSKPGGMGIGLAISKQLANHLGARLELRSTSAAGTVFELALPSVPVPLDEHASLR
ncbi:sensor histidine kinase [Fontisphaera persica]|uniref:sensor histidine kinase n=1 Tax=Fontisphaera persica TaxID=2974023 RepID=UPI0024C02237|nr:sensor histidine kinase [Fontisphaera persica]WCJ59027.1 sensor histidine kinase [Fontisphaera persica]